VWPLLFIEAQQLAMLNIHINIFTTLFLLNAKSLFSPVCATDLAHKLENKSVVGF
jgi:hypothetical protein